MFIPFILSVRTLCQIKPSAALRGANSREPGTARGHCDEIQLLQFGVSPQDEEKSAREGREPERLAREGVTEPPRVAALQLLGKGGCALWAPPGNR